MVRTAAALGALLAVVLLGPGAGGAAPSENPKLTATIGPGFTITLKTASGAAATKLDPGMYDVEVSDQSELHSFHLRGPGVDKTTSAEEVGTQSWTVTFQAGTYTFFCNEHTSSLKGSFTVGAPTTSGGGTTAAITAKTRLVLKVGPGFTITLKTATGKSFTAMKRGTYTILVRDLSSIHNAHLIAPGGVNKKTGVAFVGKVAWKVKLAKVGTLKFQCDPHRSSLHGTKKIV